MRKTKVAMPVAFTAILVTTLLVVSGHAKKSPPGLSKPVQVTGAIYGLGAPDRIAITFTEGSFGIYAGSYISNTDGGLRILGTHKGPRTLRYRYCYGGGHEDPGLCDNPEEHDPTYYVALRIYGGVLEGKGRDERIVWPSGSTWEILRKEPMGDLEASGTLAEAVIYKDAD